MLKKRMLLLVASLAAFGAMLVGTTFANVTGTANTGGTGQVAAQSIGEVGARFMNIDASVPANGVAQKVADVQAYENDGTYDLNVQSVDVQNHGTNSGSCGTGGAQWSIDNPTNLSLTPENTWLDVADLDLTIPLDAGNDCTNSGAAVDVTFVVVG